MTKGLRFGLGAGLALGFLAAAHATDPLSLVTNHATVLAYTDGAVPGMPLFTTFGSQMFWPMVAETWAVVTVPTFLLFGDGVARWVGGAHLLVGYAALGLLLARRPELTGATEG